MPRSSTHQSPNLNNWDQQHIRTPVQPEHAAAVPKSGTVTSTYTRRNYSSKTRVDCKSGNLIYCITCKTCALQYVGQTKRRLMDRFQGHFYNITSKNTKDTIGQHFNQPDHHGLHDVEIHIVDFVHTHPLSPNACGVRRTIERNWQHRLRTNAPQGLNIQEQFQSWEGSTCLVSKKYNDLGPKPRQSSPNLYGKGFHR